MPRGNPQNLTSLGDRTIEERQKIARKAGQASGKARRNKALLRDCLEILMEKKYLDKNTGKKYTGAEMLSIDLFQRALDEQDTAKKARAFEVLRDTSGQKPVDKVEQTNTSNIVVDFGDLEDGD